MGENFQWEAHTAGEQLQAEGVRRWVSATGMENPTGGKAWASRKAPPASGEAHTEIIPGWEGSSMGEHLPGMPKALG